MRNIAFSLTTPQIEAGSKDVTRRLNSTWKVGERRAAIVKGMGLKKGEKVQPIRDERGKPIVVECVSHRKEKLWKLMLDPDYGAREVVREGFPEMTALEFVEFFCREGRCKRTQVVHRLEFKRV